MPSSINSLIVNITEGASAAHAYMIEGAAGEARDAFVQEFIKGLCCQADDPADRPCAECASCRQIAAGTSMDVFHMERTSPSRNYSVRDAETLIEVLGMSPYGRYRIGVIDRADELSETIQNKLLKTLEEPEPGSVIILAVSNRDNLLQTVRSRCSLIRMSDHADEEETGEHSEAIRDLAGSLTGTRCAFHEFRQDIEKKLKSKEDALEMLALAEDRCRDRMVAGDRPGTMAQAIDLIELAVMDIQRQMDHRKALKRLFLEMEDIW